MRLSLLIPSKTDAYLARLFRSLTTCEPGWLETVEVLVADNGCSDAFRVEWTRRGIVFVPNRDPFVFSRAVNAAAAVANPRHDLFIMNDDTVLCSPYGLTRLSGVVARPTEERYGLIGARILGGVGNPDQEWELGPEEIRPTANVLCFIAVLFPRYVWEVVGPMDERFTGYGFDDNDACMRVTRAGYQLGVTGAVTVRHGAAGRSMHGSYLSKYTTEELTEMFHANRRLFEEKWRDR